MKCIPAGTAAPAAPPSGSVEDLSARLATLRTQYTTLATQATTTPAQVPTLLPQIQTINQQIAAVLDQMIAQLQHARQGPNSEAYRNELTATLARIQMDYNGLKTNTDALQTLRRIRSFQDTSWQPTLNLYLALFCIFTIVLVLVMLFRRQTKESTPATIASPPAMPTLM
jgi:ribosomal protein L29